MKKKTKTKKKKSKFTKYEIVLFIITGLICLSFPFMSIFAKSNLSEISYKLESIKTEIKKQNKNNESLEMKINELASLDNALEVADTFGLEYNNSNIRVVSE